LEAPEIVAGTILSIVGSASGEKAERSGGDRA